MQNPNPYYYPQPTPQYYQQPRQTPVYPRIVCVPVASEQEAMAMQTDFSGALQVMVDQAHGVIYTKQLSPQTGTAEFYRYAVQQPEPAPQTVSAPVPEFVGRDEFNKLKKDFEVLFDMIANGKGGNNV